METSLLARSSGARAREENLGVPGNRPDAQEQHRAPESLCFIGGLIYSTRNAHSGG